MKKGENSMGSTRRSFMKKSVVAAVAASNFTIFTGMVDARGSSTYVLPDCKMILAEFIEHGEMLVKCFFPDANGSCNGFCWYHNPDGSWYKKTVSCTAFDSFHHPDYAVCHSLSQDATSEPQP
jgi:hypothetical protein